jgi:hypothetical protein
MSLKCMFGWHDFGLPRLDADGTLLFECIECLRFRRSQVRIPCRGVTPALGASANQAIGDDDRAARPRGFHLGGRLYLRAANWGSRSGETESERRPQTKPAADPLRVGSAAGAPCGGLAA